MRIRSYFERVSEGVRERTPEGASQIERTAILLTEMIIGLPESRAWSAYPRVPSPEVSWHGPEMDPEVIERELKGIFQ